MSDETRARLLETFRQCRMDDGCNHVTYAGCLETLTTTLTAHEQATKAEAVLAFAQTLFPQEAARHAALMFAQEQGWSETPGQTERKA